MSEENPSKHIYWKAQGITLRLENGELKAGGDPTPPQIELLRENKGALIAELTASPTEPEDYAAKLRDSMEQSVQTQHEVYIPLQHPPQEPLQPRSEVKAPSPPMRAPNTLKGETVPPGAHIITPRAIIEDLGDYKIQRINEVFDLLKQDDTHYWANLSEYKATYSRNWDYNAALSDRHRLAEDAAILWLRQRIANLITNQIPNSPNVRFNMKL